jgi:hypothetical protein
MFDFSMGMDDEGVYRGSLKSMGIRPCSPTSSRTPDSRSTPSSSRPRRSPGRSAGDDLSPFHPDLPRRRPLGLGRHHRRHVEAEAGAREDPWPRTRWGTRASRTRGPRCRRGDQDFVSRPCCGGPSTPSAEAAARHGAFWPSWKPNRSGRPARTPGRGIVPLPRGHILGGAIVFLMGNFFWGMRGVSAALAVLPWVIVASWPCAGPKPSWPSCPTCLQLLGATLRSGFSILQGLDTVAVQLPDPMGKEMRHVVAEARLGRPLASALDEVAQRVRATTFEWVVAAIGIQREVGRKPGRAPRHRGRNDELPEAGCARRPTL